MVLLRDKSKGGIEKIQLPAPAGLHGFSIPLGFLLHANALRILPAAVFFSMSILAATPLWGKKDLHSRYGIEDMVDRGRWWIDAGGDLTLEQVWPSKAGHFGAYRDLPKTNPRGAALWAAFKLEEVQKDAMHRIWFSTGLSECFQVFHLYAGDVDSIDAGSLVPADRLPHAPNFMAVPINDYDHPEQIVLLRFRNISNKKLDAGEVFLATPDQEAGLRAAFHDMHSDCDIYYLAFLAALIALFAFFFLQWVVQRSPPLLFYSSYLAVCGLYYLRHWENKQFNFRLFFGNLGIGQLYAEILLAFVAYSAYILFVVALLDLPEKRPGLARLLKTFAVFFLAALPIVWFAGWYGGAFLMETVYLYIRIAFFMLSFWIVAHLMRTHRRHPMTKFIIAGTLLLLVGMVMTLSEEIFGGRLEKDIAGGAFGWYIHKEDGLRFPVYDFKIGVLLEMLVFSLGLARQQHMQNEAYRAVKAASLKSVAVDSHSPAEAAFYPFTVSSEFVCSAVACVEQNMADEDFKVQQLADAMQISREMLYQRLKREIDLDPTLFLRTIRLWQARRMLESGTHTVATAAYAVGFKYPYYFSKVFKETFGFNPKSLLKRKSA